MDDPRESYLGLESVVQGDSSQCIKPIFQLHFPDAATVADLTWGKGRFWKWLGADGPRVVGFDIEPMIGAQVQADYRFVPVATQSVDVAIFDPPFIFSPGIAGIVGAKRFFLGAAAAGQRFYGGADNTKLRIAAPRNADELHQHTRVVAHEMRRIARYGMIFKGQNLVTSHHPNWWEYRTMRAVEESLGLLPEDRLIQVSPAARLRDPRWKRQMHFRRRDAIYLIYTWEPQGGAT